MLPRWWPTYRVGIVPRLTVAFLAVAVLAITANMVIETGPPIIQRVDVPPNQSAPASPPGIAPVPLTRPLPKTISPPSDERLLAAITRFSSTTASRIADQSPARIIEANEASESLSRAGKEYLRRARAGGNTSKLDQLDALLDSQQRDAARMIAIADGRRLRFAQYQARFEELDIRMKGAIDRAWTILGRVVARQYLIDMSRTLDRIRPDLAILPANAASISLSSAAIGANETAFATILQDHESSLRRTQGSEWFDLAQSDVRALAEIRSALEGFQDSQVDALARFTQSNERLAALVRGLTAAGLAAKAAIAVMTTTSEGTTASPSRGPTTRTAPHRRVSKPSGVAKEQRFSLAWISIFTLALLLVSSIATMLSIIRPVRRLMLATQRIANGEPGVLVSRGGIRELDSLALSFNQMAERLTAAQAEMRKHHGQLEAKVDERTRQLQHQAEHDPLTQLPNRRQLFVKLNGALASAAHNKCLVGVYFLDLDNFKNINDSMGHVFGDRVLQSFSERLQGLCAPYGFAARVGGDEFTVVMETAANIDAIVAAGSALVRAFHQPLHIDGRELSVSLSVGASVYPDHEADAEALLQAADAALFRAKALGRSQVCLFSRDLMDAVESKFNTEQGLRRAIARGEFELFFQPEVNAGTGEVELVEALLRWRLPNGKYLLPADFLPVAEESGLIGEITDWVITTAVETAARWHHTAWPEVRVAINLSSRHLLDGSFVDGLQDLLRRNNLPTPCIEIELTENVLQTGSMTIQALHRLRAAGFGVALDDFGTGYSSLVSLEQLPLSRVKLDRGLIANIDSSARSLAITRAIIGICTSLGLEITAEGVERREQLDILLGHPRMTLQGFLFSPPVSSGEVLSLIANMAERVRFLLKQPGLVTISSTQRRRAQA